MRVGGQLCSVLVCVTLEGTFYRWKLEIILDLTSFLKHPTARLFPQLEVGSKQAFSHQFWL